MSSRTVPAELCQGPYDGRTGEVTFKDEPPERLLFSLADKDSKTLIVVAAASLDDELTAIYRRIDEKPRKVLVFDDNGNAHSAKGVRYRYDKASPCQTLFDDADRRALLTADAAGQVNNTRKLLLEERARRRESA